MTNLVRPVYQIVLTRGLAREARHWGRFNEELKVAYDELGIDARIETLDLPGCGRHSEMHAHLTIDQTADFAREKFKEILVREAEQGQKPADHRRLVAISLGGMVGASWLSRYPTDFHSGVFMNSSFRGVSKIYERLHWKSWWRVPFIIKNRDIAKREAQILEWVSNDETKRCEALPLWVSIQESRPVSTLNLGIQLAAAAQFQAPPKIGVPLLVLASKNDRMVNSSCSEALARIYNARIESHPTAGHDLSLDAGPWTAAMIAKWKQLPVA
jgi:alpha-beta hydrolase superfamily lysophospholipase